MFGRRRRAARAEPRIEIDDTGVRRHLADGGVEEVRWDDLGEVRVITTSDGPFAEDVFFVLAAASGDHGCVVGQGFTDEAFLARLQALPGFDDDALIEAMSTAHEADFLLWRAPPG
jgi:hypothetical protein